MCKVFCSCFVFVVSSSPLPQLWDDQQKADSLASLSVEIGGQTSLWGNLAHYITDTLSFNIMSEKVPVFGQGECWSVFTPQPKEEEQENKQSN